MLDNIPVYLISGHSCIGVEVGDTGTAKYKELEFPFAFTVPRNTFLLSFSEPGSSTCLDKKMEPFIHSQVELIRQLFYLHGPDEFIDHAAESIFSRSTRATGSPGERIRFPNVLYTFEPTQKGAPRPMNEFGVFDISDYKAVKATSNLDSIIAQFDPSLPVDDINKKDWTLEDIIKRTYQVTGTDKAIFLNMGCLTPCGKDSSSIDKAAHLMHRADAMYKNIIPVMSRRNMNRLGAETLIDHTDRPRLLLGALKIPEFRRMLESGLYDPKSFGDLLDEFHPDDVRGARQLIKEFIAKEEAETEAEAKR